MAQTFDTAHVRNVGEFFSQHYLEAVLEKDLASVFKRWKEGEQRTPQKAMASLAEPFFRVLASLDERAEDLEVATASVNDWHAQVLEALGYARVPTVKVLPDETEVPLLLAVESSGRPFLWVGQAGFGAAFGQEEDDSPLELPPLRTGEDEEEERASWKALLDGVLLRQEHAPRWVLLLAGPDVFLVDRDRWPQGRYLHFELGAMLGHRKPAALRALVGLLHREVLAPEAVSSGGRSLLDEIDEKSHKHAFAVSTDLKYGVQKAIELLGNEVVRHKREVAKQKLYERPELAKELSRECITFMYRLLFVFYVEARGGEVGAVPVNSDAYRKGLSLESLRDLELIPLQSDKARNGTFIHESLKKLFQVIHLGWPTSTQESTFKQYDNAVDLRVRPQRSPLFDPAKTPLLSSVKLRNSVLQQIIGLLSLSKEGRRGAGGRQRGRISYAQLGINQLGAVYEGLLSYTGFFAQETLHEVKRASDKGKDGTYEHVYYVPASRIEPYTEDELVRDKHGRPVTHDKGTFLFRLAGRDREKSASYYTPQVLTECLTKYTLKERLGEPGTEGALSADEILELTVCEPAMGSGAFLGEAVSQLAHAYLERKQAELGKTIPAEEYQREWTRAKYHFVAHNVYGVDLNPLATELGRVSLWLGVLDADLQAPYLDLRLVTGNSLIGARREVYRPDQLTRKATKAEPNWWGEPGQRLKPGEARPKDAVYHFLVPNEGMAPYDKDKVVKGLCPDEVKTVKAWHKAMAKPFTKDEVRTLQEMSAAVDELWARHAAKRKEAMEKLWQPVQVWGQAEIELGKKDGPRHKTVEECEGIAQAVLFEGDAGDRLKAVMDWWCGMWTWPLLEAGTLPGREKWFAEIGRLLKGGATEEERKRDEGRFVHWELAFAEVFEGRGGFDVILGNPPWLKVEWRSRDVLDEQYPLLAVRSDDEAVALSAQDEVFSSETGLRTYLSEYSFVSGTQSYLSRSTDMHILQGMQSNLYKSFLVKGWEWGGPGGVSGLLHQHGVLDDPKGGAFRETYYRHARLVCVFRNELRLFSEIGNVRPYAMSVCTSSLHNVGFRLVTELLHPVTLEGSLHHDGTGEVPGGKNTQGDWNLAPHADRVIDVSQEELMVFAEIFEDRGTPPRRTRLPLSCSRSQVSVLASIARAPRLQGRVVASECFHETSRRNDGTIAKTPVGESSSAVPEDVVISGPNIGVADPLSKDANPGCTSHRDFSSVDLCAVPDDRLPRGKYRRACDKAEFLRRMPAADGVGVASHYYSARRTNVGSGGSRTLMACVMPPKVGHVHGVSSFAFADERELLEFSGVAASLLGDFFVRSAGVRHIHHDLMRRLPASVGAYGDALVQRVLQLNCVSSHYSALYERRLPSQLLPSTRNDGRCRGWDRLPPVWGTDVPLRHPFGRRQAMVELDVLVALGVGVSLEKLCFVFRTGFPVLMQYERETYYDGRGKIVFTNNRGLSGVGLARKEWEPIMSARAGDELPSYAHDQQGPYEPPFDRCDREEDMAQAYKFFEERLGAR